MLVLTRRAGESIMIDDEVELKVLKIRGSQVHLGIDAPEVRVEVHISNGLPAFTVVGSRYRCPQESFRAPQRSLAADSR